MQAPVVAILDGMYLTFRQRAIKRRPLTIVVWAKCVIRKEALQMLEIGSMVRLENTTDEQD
jgi:hypothetical protein